jgi:hypothetical protein
MVEWSWSEVIYAELEATHKDVEAMPLVFKGNKLFEINRSYLWCDGAALISLADM